MTSHDDRPAPSARRRTSLGFALALLVAPAVSSALDEPVFQLERTVGKVELRRYSAYTVAEVLMAGDATRAGNAAFPILLGYISGRNQGARKFAMTAPVTQSAAVPVKFAMTAPVMQSEGEGGTRVGFVLPQGVKLADAPLPLDARVQLREQPARRIAVLRYSGRWTAENDAEQLAALRAALEAAGMAATGEPVFAKYDAPYTPWFLRRNEVWLALP